MLKSGDVLGEKYRILKTLGQGGTGRVYLAENINVGNRWAVKEINLNNNNQFNLLAEPEILKKLNHRSLPRIVDMMEIVDIGEKSIFLYIIEDYFEGQNLQALIKNREACNEANVIKWAVQLCEILMYLHNLKPNPIIYRDMKPGNIIIDRENNVKLVDFNIAREFKATSACDTAYIGTRGYAAPEQYAGVTQTDERTDIYGLGATLYHVLTGRSPHDHPYHMVPVRQLDNTLSEGIERIIAKCVQDNPELRYRRVEGLLSDLEEL